MPAVIVAGGGTGGHIFPGIAIARELVERDPRLEVLFVGTQRGLETKLVPAAGFRLLTIRSAGITGKRIAARLAGLALIPVSLWQSFRLLKLHRPVLAIGVGGYASGPVLASAALLRVPTLIHEQNFVPGLTNRWLARMVTQVATTFPETVARLGGRGVVTGNPVRREFAMPGPRPPHAGARSLLICGGSQGARAINRAVCDALPLLASRGAALRITHQSGERDLEMVTEAYERAGIQAQVRPFIGDMAGAMQEADLLVCRAGSTTLAELTAAGRPALLIPFAAATHDHQTFNARKLAAAGAAVMIPESELSGASLAAGIGALLDDPARLAAMGAASRRLGRPEAAARIADLCLELMAPERRAAAGGTT